jgi:outer membrane protein OmpA-like peptidoglycan-associated protein
MKTRTALITLAAAGLFASTAAAQDAAGESWIEQNAPEDGLWELSLYGGALLPSDKLELYEPDVRLPNQGYKGYEDLAPGGGLRLGYYPWASLGFEGEAGVMIASEATDGESVLLWTLRGHVLLQYSEWRLTPFVLAGAGMLNASSGSDVVGSDIDPALHIGAGFKYYVNEWAQLRFDVRDNITPEAGGTGFTNNLELLGSIGIVWGRSEPVVVVEEKPLDTDNDGILDKDDKCVDEPENINGFEDEDGCPELDSDGDGILDAQDSCPEAAENVNGIEDEDGCPEGDRDGDGVLDPKDECPDEKGDKANGCPTPDTDGDGILDPDDKCVNDPETKNGFKDADGCPDEVPKEMEKFTGVIKGIYFATAKDTIKPASRKTLDAAAKTLKKFTTVEVLIAGHTDNVGKRDYNLDLSNRRAEAVKAYLVSKGVSATRIKTKGFGPDKPVADNKKKAGRAKNRRIEFELITK